MALIDSINTQIADIDSKIERIKTQAREQVERLAIKRATLVKMRSLITAELEGAVAALQKEGLVEIKPT